MSRFSSVRSQLCGAVCLFLLLTTATLSPGCRVAADDEARLSGSVTLDDVPLENGSITILPVDGNSVTAGTTISNGAFAINVTPGQKKVVINSSQVVGQRPSYEGVPDSPMVDVTKEIIPPRYNVKSELVIDVIPGDNIETFNLRTK